MIRPVDVRTSSERQDVEDSTTAYQPGTAEVLPVGALRPADSPRLNGENVDRVRVLAELATELPPIVVHRPTMRVVDGMHRLRAAIRRGDDVIAARFFDGSDEDAFLLAVKLNGAHGLPLTLAERSSAAARIVDFHPEWSDRRIAEVVGLAANTVGTIRVRSTAQSAQLNTSVGRDGRVRPHHGAPGRQLAGELMREHPTASLREIAKAAGIALATASDVRARMDRGEPPVTPGQRSARRRNMPPIAVVSTDTVPAQVSSDLLHNLARDPSLRLTDAGKTLLRSSGICTIDAEQRARMIQAIPAHLHENVISLAQACASAWQDLADRLAK